MKWKSRNIGCVVARTASCADLLASLDSDSTTARYIRLLEHVSSKVRVGEVTENSNPMDFSNDMEATERFVYHDAFRSHLAEGGIDWGKVNEAKNILASRLETDSKRIDDADEKAKPIFHPIPLNAKLLEKPLPFHSVMAVHSASDGTIAVELYDRDGVLVIPPDAPPVYRDEKFTNFLPDSNLKVEAVVPPLAVVPFSKKRKEPLCFY